MASWGRPISTVRNAACALERLPRVEPPGISERFTKSWQGTPALRQMLRKTAALTPSVVYFWFALCLSTMPPLTDGRLTGSALAG